MERIGVRELRQHASRYLARVAAGEHLEVTDRGRPVALLVPVGAVSSWEGLLDAGRVRRAIAPDTVLAEDAAEYGLAASAALADARREER
ncbi:MAG: hypothetical protein NVSMB13_19240 [Mycobacteriales bacterium]